MGRLKVVNVVGARPNLMKMAPIMWEMNKVNSIEPVLIHTGQHYDHGLSDIFFLQLDIPKPNFYLDVGSGSHSYQTAQIMIRLEELLQYLQPEIVLVVGDVNSTVAAALVATKLRIPVAHVEAGLRSFDRTMPEEINRVVTDSIAQTLFVTEVSGVENLRREGIQTFLNGGEPLMDISQAVLEHVKDLCIGSPTRFGAFVGNVMIDTLVAIKDKAEQEAKINVPERDYALLTLHRPSNVDDPEILGRIIYALSQVAREICILFPCHPRTRLRIQEFGLDGLFKPVEACSASSSFGSAISLLEPLGYFEFLKLMTHAKLVLTDSGGIQEETTILGIPCFTLRENTERPVTLTEGTNTLVGTDSETIIRAVEAVLNGQAEKGRLPILWDGKAASRIVKILEAIGPNDLKRE